MSSAHSYYDLLRKTDTTPATGFPATGQPIRSGAWIYPQAIVLTTRQVIDYKPNLLRKPATTAKETAVDKPRLRCPDGLPAPSERPASRYDRPVVLW
ncbi:hypothetical protein BDF19DRAFT_444264 [Syncephalis fuscata]|nr:hypothetical protein BDF19DRAFT_444264 [Syncephalis fuscata]